MKLTGIPSYNHIMEIRLEQRCGTHGNLRCLLSIDEKQERAFHGAINAEVKVVPDELSIFNGIVQSVSIDKQFSAIRVEILAASTSILEELEPKCRIFQSDTNKYGDILSRDKLELKNCDISLGSSIKAMKYKEIAFQNQESNFSFIKRLAEKANVPVWVNDFSASKAKIVLQDVLIDSVRQIKDKDIIKWRIINAANGNRAEIKLRDYINLGRKVSIENDGKTYVVYAVTMEMEHGSIYYTYELREDKKLPVIDMKMTDLEKTVRLKAKVKNQDDPEHKGRLQVEFIDEGLKDVNKDKPRWLPFIIPYTGKAGGVVFIPDKDDVVDVVFSNGECYVTAARRENKLADECQKVIDKYIGNNTKQRIFWKEKSLELMSDENKIYMDKEKIELTVGTSKITMDKDSIILKAGKAVMRLDKNGIVMDGASSKMQLSSNGIDGSGRNVKIGGNNSIELSGGSTAKLHGGSKVAISGSSINLA